MLNEARFAVLLKDEGQFLLGPLAQGLSAHLRVPVPDAMFEAKKCWGIVGEHLDLETAGKLVENLQANKIAALIVPEEKIRTLSPVHAVGKEGLAWDTFPWERVRVLGAAVIRAVTQHTTVEKQGPTPAQRAASIGIMMATGLPISIGPKSKTVQKTTSETELSYFLDIVIDGPPERHRIAGDQINYAFLKERMLMNAPGNFRLMLGDVVARAPQAVQNRGTRILLAGQPVNTMGYETLADLERECRWLFSI